MNTKNMWNTAGTAGLALGGVSSIYLFLTQLLSGSMEEVSLWQQILSFVLWTIKFCGCIWIMWFFMKKFASENKDADNKDVFRMGMATAVLSAILYSAVNLANMLYISADYYQTLYQTLMEQMSGVLDSNSMTMMEQMIEHASAHILLHHNLLFPFRNSTLRNSFPQHTGKGSVCRI